LSESHPAGRKVFFDFAMPPKAVAYEVKSGSTGCAARCNGCKDFIDYLAGGILLGA
jgi:hypothetical protein